MLSRRAASLAARSARPAVRTTQTSATRAPFSTARSLQATAEDADPNMNGGYINPPAIKRSHRDPYGEYTDKQERRNFGEPVHEDNDIMGIFALEDYRHMTAGRGLILWTGFIGIVLGLSYAVAATYPDRPSASKEYADGLDSELGSTGSLRAFQSGDES